MDSRLCRRKATASSPPGIGIRRTTVHSGSREAPGRRIACKGHSGAQFHPDLKIPPGTLIVSGATNPKHEAYSGFDGTTLDERLEDLGARTLYVLGLATD